MAQNALYKLKFSDHTRDYFWTFLFLKINFKHRDPFSEHAYIHLTLVFHKKNFVSLEDKRCRAVIKSYGRIHKEPKGKTHFKYYGKKKEENFF